MDGLEEGTKETVGVSGPSSLYGLYNAEPRYPLWLVFSASNIYANSRNLKGSEVKEVMPLCT